MASKKLIYQVDAFTSEPFRGNPAGVCLLENEMPADWMQKIAAEMNLSETAFLIPGGEVIPIRYFTPEAEVELCGHATLSAGHILFQEKIAGDEIVFSSKAGNLKVTRHSRWIKMNFPSFPVKQIRIPDDIEKITGIRPVELYSSSYDWILALFNSENEVRNLKPDFKRMKRSRFGHLIITAPSSETNFDFVVRCFAPSIGINEDPVTGSAHCALVPFWNMKTGRNDFVSCQVSKRGGVLKVSLEGERVEISGQARTIFKGRLLV